jgi:hypothetical protein
MELVLTAITGCLYGRVHTHEGKMESFNIEISNAPNARFTGEQIACVTANYGFTKDKMILYRLMSGKFYCLVVHKNLYTERAESAGALCESIEEVTKYFGWSDPAKELYKQAGFEVDVDLDDA